MATVLIIEDQADMRGLLQVMVEESGHTPLVATQGVEGLHLLKQHPDLVILDLNMPLATGDVVLGFMRSTPELVHTPALVISGEHNAETIAAQLGADACLKKPVSVGEVTATIHRLLAQAGRP